MVRIPLSCIYWYDPARGLYEQIGTHHTITIEQYEKLEKERERIAEINCIIGLASCAVLFVFVLIPFLITVITL